MQLANDYQPPRNGGAQYKKTFTAVSTDQDLRAQSGYPTHAPGLLQVVGGAAGGDLVYTDLAGNVNTMHIPIETEITIDGPVAAIDGDSADDLDITAHWWVDSATRLNP
jgi:hypothetical protein